MKDLRLYVYVQDFFFKDGMDSNRKQCHSLFSMPFIFFLTDIAQT